MNKEWSERNKKMQALLAKEATFAEGIEVLLALRNDLFEQITSIVKTFPADAFYQMPFGPGDGNHHATLAWSLWHVFRIEDIVAHTLILKDRQVFLENGWQTKTKSPIATTGNELDGEAMVAFSKVLDVNAVYEYCTAVRDSTNKLLKHLQFSDLKKKFSPEDKEKLAASNCVSSDGSAVWLIDYWCGKDVRGLIQMPFSRHWIMHVEAMCRIKNELCRKARKGVDPVAHCGLSCDHCFLKDWCGGCRTPYNTCSYATCCSDRICPNAACCKKKGLDGCYECDDIVHCRTGFYANGNDGNAVKAMSLFIRKHGKKELAAVLDKLHTKYDFQKIQEILGFDLEEGLKILEENL